MPRDSYYQETGNPIRRELLPKRKLSLALAVPDVPTVTRAATFVALVLIIAGVSFVDSLLASFSESMLLSLGRGILVAAGSQFVLLHFAKCGCTRIERTIAMLLAIICPIGAGIAVWWDVSPAFCWLNAAVISFCYARLFVLHWSRLCVTSPISRSTASSLLIRWDRKTFQLASLPLVAWTLVWLLGPTLTACLMGGLGISALVWVPGYWSWRNWRAAWQSLGSWLTYCPTTANVPGLFLSPSGNVVTRTALSVCGSLTIAACVRDAFAWPGMLPSIVALVLPVLLMQPILAAAASYRREKVRAENWSSLVDDLRTSSNPIERNSYYMARVVSDQSPVLVPRRLFGEHAHFLGGTGTGKTSLGLAPFIEQSIQFGDVSLVVIDLKADTLELLATMTAAAQRLRRERDIELPLKYLTTRDDLSTFAFNPMTQPFWSHLNSYKKTDLLNGAAGLKYDPTYGADFYMAANDGVSQYTFEKYPDVQTFDELADRCGHILVSADKRELHSEIRKNGVLVHEVLKRLASFAPLNVAPGGNYPDDVIAQSIDLADVFRTPQLLYFHLSSILGPGSAPALARFVCYFLLAAAAQVERNVPVYLVIDEFQRMAAQNFEYMLQLARSMGVGIILANQSMEDLKTGKIDLISTIESNCRYRQWFGVGSSADSERLARSSGETVEFFTTRSTSSNSNGGTSTSTSRSEQVMPRLSGNDIFLASDHPKQSIIHIARGEGYAQYGGLPFICESDYHITEGEYERRRKMPWPNREPGTFIPDEWDQQPTVKPPRGPIVTTEVIGGNHETDNDPFADLVNDLESEQPPKRKRRRGRR